MNARIALIVVVVGFAGSQAHAGLLFGKKSSKPVPAERVPELIKTLQSEGDESKRASAAEEMRQYDPAQFPDMIPALIQALSNDSKPSVRVEAAQTLAKLRPVNQAAGAALEQAQAKDASMRVRLQARSCLLQYRWAGYSAKSKDQPITQSQEPPLADPIPPTKATSLKPAPMPPSNTPKAVNALPTSRTPAPIVPPADDKGPELTPP